MVSLRCCTFNCRGWNNDSLSLQDLFDSFDLCFVQEHWLLHDHLYKLDCFSSYFQLVGVSGMDSCCLLEDWPFGGCAILFRNKLLPYITPLVSC